MGWLGGRCCGDDALTRFQLLIAGESSSDRAIKMGFRQRILQTSADTQSFEPAQVQHRFHSFRTRGMEVDGNKNAADADLVVLEAVMSRVQISIHFQADSRTELLRPSRLKIILCISAYIAHALV